VSADPFRLEQALVNVTANAFRHTPDGGVVELKSELKNGMIVLSVTDSGNGIPAEHLPLIFDRFYKVPASSRTQWSNGSGLGLSIVKAIIERHGGRVSARSEPGNGTTICLALPVPSAVDTPWARLG
jgi:signal transduction histidine kinase